MTRAEMRAEVVRVLESLDVFQHVTDHEPNTLSGSPLAAIHSKSMELEQVARGLYDIRSEVWVTIYVRRTNDDAVTAEEQLDALVLQVMIALHAALNPIIPGFQIGQSQTGYPNRLIDGRNYRIERFSIQFETSYRE